MNKRRIDPACPENRDVPFPGHDAGSYRQFLTPEEVAREVGVNVDTVRQWIAARELVASDVSRAGSRRPTWRIHRGDLEGFLARRKTIQNLPVPRRKQHRFDSTRKFI